MPFRHPERALFVAMLVNLAAVLGIAGLTLNAVQYRSAERREDCERRVDTREDTRAMWIWLVDQFPGDDLAERARTELDLRLPSLRCDGPIPIPEED